MDEKLLTAIQGLIRQSDELHAQHVTELEQTIAGLHDVLRSLATQTMRLADIAPPSDAADAAIIDAVVAEGRKVMQYLDPPSH